MSCESPSEPLSQTSLNMSRRSLSQNEAVQRQIIFTVARQDVAVCKHRILLSPRQSYSFGRRVRSSSTAQCCKVFLGVSILPAVEYEELPVFLHIQHEAVRASHLRRGCALPSPSRNRSGAAAAVDPVELTVSQIPPRRQSQNPCSPRCVSDLCATYTWTC